MASTPETPTWSAVKPPPSASTASMKMVSAAPSLIRLSPSRIVTIRGGAPSRCITAVAATGSVGDTAAPNASAAAQPTSGTSAWTVAATATVVTVVSPNASVKIGTASARASRGAVKKAAW